MFESAQARARRAASAATCLLMHEKTTSFSPSKPASSSVSQRTPPGETFSTLYSGRRMNNLEVADIYDGVPCVILILKVLKQYGTRVWHSWISIALEGGNVD